MPLEIIPKARANELVVQELGKELLIYDLENHKAYGLNKTSALVWQMCDGNRSVSEISRLIAKELESTINEDLVWLAIDQLKKGNLLENSREMVVDFRGLSRLEVIRKVGLATMIALPVIASLTAPTAAQAQSQSTNCAFNPDGAPAGTLVSAAAATCEICTDRLLAQCCNADPSAISCSPSPFNNVLCSVTCS